MHVIETISVEEAAVALGLRPAAIRQRIKSGELAAALVGRKFRVGIASVNKLLAGAAPVPSAPAVQPLAQMVAQRPAEPSPEPVPDVSSTWAMAARRSADADPHAESDRRWLREMDALLAKEQAEMSAEEFQSARMVIPACSSAG